MSDLQNQTPANTYKGLLQVDDYTNGVDSTAKFISDGEGTPSALSVSTTKVGVGTASPSQELDVNGNVVATTLTTSGAVTAGSVSTSGAVGAGEYALDQTGSSSSAVAIHAPATNELAIRTNSTEAMRIDSNGNCGIGTTSPNAPLEIKGSRPSIRLTDDDPTGQSVFEIVNNESALAIYDNTNIGLSNILHINGGTGATAGNIGMGTVTPSAPLEVSSTRGGVIMPRLTTTERDAISSPTNGEMIYNTTTNKFQGRANGAWVDFH
jgi:hypothetical protein